MRKEQSGTGETDVQTRLSSLLRAVPLMQGADRVVSSAMPPIEVVHTGLRSARVIDLWRRRRLRVPQVLPIRLKYMEVECIR